MKNYSKAKIVAKNAPTGSYAAGCTTKDKSNCCYCQRSQ